MNQQIPPDIQERIAARIAKGQFSSEVDVLRRAMDALDQLEEEKLRQWHERHQRAIEEAECGEARPIDEVL
ncbi:hypothetical protein Pan97_42070 [Bremerella volcania]|uniref:Type II toxin-antitoxin system ParD family antitoxin n=1 Tax=Bremerella volcania TaxID=2527984 RepID=A0A518CD36_9BACT|nr:hypothetical protein [Bremerella volcania]QDU77145.1 hypothetical protein Pan97_42070 [Bremerella volcania]